MTGTSKYEDCWKPSPRQMNASVASVPPSSSATRPSISRASAQRARSGTNAAIRTVPAIRKAFTRAARISGSGRGRAGLVAAPARPAPGRLRSADNEATLLDPPPEEAADEHAHNDSEVDRHHRQRAEHGRQPPKRDDGTQAVNAADDFDDRGPDGRRARRGDELVVVPLSDHEHPQPEEADGPEEPKGGMAGDPHRLAFPAPK